MTELAMALCFFGFLLWLWNLTEISRLRVELSEKQMQVGYQSLLVEELAGTAENLGYAPQGSDETDFEYVGRCLRDGSSARAVTT